MTALEVFTQSDGEVTKAYYAELKAIGPAGEFAMNLFRAQKTSTRAKRYRGRPGRGEPTYRSMAYDVKAFSLKQLCLILSDHAASLGVTWGWGIDFAESFNRHVLYIDLPGYGQVSFHSPERYSGPEYPGAWDGAHKSAERILAFCNEVHASMAKPKSTRTPDDDGTITLRIDIALDPETERGKHILSTFADFLVALNGLDWAKQVAEKMHDGMGKAIAEGKRLCTVELREEVF